MMFGLVRSGVGGGGGRVTALRLARYSSHSSSSSSSTSSASSQSQLKQSDSKPFDPLKEYTIFGNLRKEKKDVFHYTDRKSGTGYSDFSNTYYQHRPNIWPPLRKLYWVNYYMAIAVMVLAILDWERIYKFTMEQTSSFRPEAAQLHGNSSEKENDGAKDSDSESEGDVDKKKSKKKKNGFRERRIVEYEDRLRMYSTPDKIFRYFATLKVMNENDPSGRAFHVYMTPDDFLRSFTPGVMQSRRYGLDKFRVYDPAKHHVNFSNPGSIFYKLGEKGLISFSDYLFLMTLLSTSPQDFELAFQIFDTNGDGALDIEEFRRVQFLVMSQTMVGQKHRDHNTGGSNFRDGGNSVLEAYFFGKDKNKRLTAAKFLQFQAKLHRDVLEMEFERRVREEEREEQKTLSYEGFAEMLLQYAQIQEVKKKAMMKRLRRKFHGEDGVSLQEVLSFFHVLFHIEDIDMALHFHRIAGVPMTPALFRRISRRVSGVDLPDHIVNVVTVLFDENGDGKLSNEEFVDVVRRRLQRGLERPRDTGFFRFVDACWECTLKAATGMPVPS